MSCPNKEPHSATPSITSFASKGSFSGVTVCGSFRNDGHLAIVPSLSQIGESDSIDVEMDGGITSKTHDEYIYADKVREYGVHSSIQNDRYEYRSKDACGGSKQHPADTPWI